MASLTDDYGDTQSTAGKLLPGSSTTGVINYYLDRDWFKIPLEALVTYKITLKGDAASNWAANWLPASINFVDPIYSFEYNLTTYTLNKYGAEPVITIKVERAGDYYLDISSDYRGGYTLSATIESRDDYSGYASKNSPVLTVGGQRNGTIEAIGDSDTFQVLLEAGKTYTFEGLGIAGSSGLAAVPRLSLSQSGNYDSYAFNQVAGFPTNVYASVSGIYFLTVSDALQSTGDYTIKAKLAVDDYIGGTGATTTLAIGSTIKGKIELPSDEDWFKVSLAENVTYNFILRDPTGKSYLRLFESNGQFAGAYDTEIANVGRMITWTPAKSGDYFISAKGFNGAPDYSLELVAAAKDDYLASVDTSGLLASNATINGRFETVSDTDWIRVDLLAGTAYTFNLSKALLASGASGLLRDFKLVDADGRVIQESLNNSDPSGTTLVYQPRLGVSAYLAVNGSQAPLATYSITSTASSADQTWGSPYTTATIKPGDAIVQSVDFNGDKDWFRVDLKAGETYSFVVNGSGREGGTLLVPSLHLYDANSNYAYYTNTIYDETGFTFRPAAAGTYYLEVSGQPPYTGSYTVKMGDTSTPLKDTTGPHYKDIFFREPMHLLSSGYGSDLVFEFNEGVQTGSGQIKLSLANGTLLETFDIKTSPLIKLDPASPHVMKIDPASAWLANTDYVIEFPAGVVADKYGNPAAAKYVQAFHTPDAPSNIKGSSGKDIFRAGTGSDKLDGGAGTDTVIYRDVSSHYILENRSGSLTITTWANVFDIDELTSIERVQFLDMGIAFDLKGPAGQIYRVYKAAFDRTPDLAGLGYWLSQVDGGLSLNDAAGQFIASAEFKKLYGTAAGNDAYIKKVYENVLDRAPDSAGLDYWNSVMQGGATQADVLLMFSESTENQLAVSGSIQYGIAYTPFY